MKKNVLLLIVIVFCVNSYSQQKKKDVKIIKVNPNIFSKKKKQNTPDLQRNQNILMYPLPKVVQGVYSNFNPDYKEVYVQVYRGEVSPININYIDYRLMTNKFAEDKIKNYYLITIGGHTKYKNNPEYPEVGSYLYLHWKFETIEKYKDVIDLLENRSKGKLVLVGTKHRYMGRISLYPLGFKDDIHVVE